MNITKNVKEKSEVELKVELSVEEFAPFLEEAIKKVASEVDIPGFRKGQAPMDVLPKKVGEMTIYQEAGSFAVNKTLPKAIEQEGLETVGHPSINIEKLAPENVFIYSAILPVLPEITLGDVSKIKATKESPEVSDEEIEKVINNLREMRAKEVLVEREAQKGDKTEISFKVFLDNVPIDGGASEKYPLVLGSSQMIPGFEEQVIGMKKDEEKEFTLDFPKEYHNKQLAGKAADFKVKVLSVFDRQMPELDDGFASEVGDFETMDALKDEVEKNIFTEKEQKHKDDFERAIIESFVELSTFGDIPSVMVNQEAQTMMQELEQNISKQGLKFDDYLLHLKKDRKQMLLDFAPDAVRRIKAALAIKFLSKEKDFKVENAELETEVNKYKEMYAINPQMVKQVESPAYKDYLKTVLRNKKTLDWLVSEVDKK